MATRVMVMAGGTGGHVFPALAVAQRLREQGWEVTWLGTPDSFESRTVPQYGFPIDWIHSFRLRGQGLFSLLLAPFRMLRAMLQAWQVLRRRRPQVVLGMGGFVTGPGGLVSRLARIPLVIHEQNTIPGLTNRYLAKVARRVLEAFPGAFPAAVGAEAVGNPVRAEISNLPDPAARFAERHGACRLLVLGGSLGAQALNKVVPQALALLPAEHRFEVLHQAGRDKAEAAQSAYRAAGVNARVTDFLHDMAEAYGWADLVLCRAGALTISELTSAGVASVLVPFPHAVDDHQTRNARFLSDAGAARLLPQEQLNPESLAALLREFCDDRARLLTMAETARSLARPAATERVAAVCAEVLAHD
jgi:UDP-N-acetylglucosamine--N-acetylmuramyl-(pentapeptide) pyrophosphoryl-undecaprenol N-acetylglucosamine transferase